MAGTGEHPPSVIVLPRQARLDRLVAVLPIAQVQEHNGVEMLALALECYTVGFVVTLQIQSHGAVAFIDFAPAVALDVTDDRGGRYTCQPSGSLGEGARNDWQWRLAYRCTPAREPQARTLRLEIPALQWVRPDPVRQRSVPALTVTGLWIFTAILPAASPNPASGIGL